jgi:hypothetical protein
MVDLDLDKDSVLKVVDVMFIYIRESAKLNKCDSFPGRPILMDAVLEGLRNIFAYQDKHNIDISKRDTIKIFAFAIPQLNKRIKTLRLKNFDMPDFVPYMACMDFINTTYAKYINLNFHPDMKNTCRILGELTDSGNELAGYTYLKGVQETCICSKKTP